MNTNHRRPPPPLFPFVALDLMLALLVGIGLLGALWVSDDFDDVRFQLLGWAAVPAVVLYFSSRLLYPKWPERRPRVALCFLTVLGLAFSTGVIPLINALTTDGTTHKRTIDAGRGLAVRDVKTGGLGWTFKTRF